MTVNLKETAVFSQCNMTLAERGQRGEKQKVVWFHPFKVQSCTPPANSQKSKFEDENLYSPRERRVASVISQVGTNPTGRETDTILVQ